MKHKIKVVTRKPNGEPSVITIDQLKLENMTDLLDGGYLEAVSFLDRYSLYCDEDGKSKNLEPNLNYLPHDIIVGPIFVAGTLDKEGYHNDLTDEDILVITREIKQRSLWGTKV